jgi:hypothetical protein
MCRDGVRGQGSAAANRAGDELAGSDTASHEDAVGELETRERGFRILGIHDPEETEHSPATGQSFYAAVAEPESNAKDSGPGARVNGRAAERAKM